MVFLTVTKPLIIGNLFIICFMEKKHFKPGSIHPSLVYALGFIYFYTPFLLYR